MLSQSNLAPRIAAHLETLSRSRKGRSDRHREAGKRLTEWLVANHRADSPPRIAVVCTGNSRRSVLGAMMGNAAASFVGLPEIHFVSTGTAPSAFNPRTIATLRAIGFEIEPTGEHAPPGPAGEANPTYRVRWGSEPNQELIEFSKALGDPTLPSEGFAALMVCGEADAGCPIVPGASTRISMPFDDPKDADGTANESARYAEIRDAIGELLLGSLSEAANRIGRP